MAVLVAEFQVWLGLGWDLADSFFSNRVYRVGVESPDFEGRRNQKMDDSRKGCLRVIEGSYQTVW